MQGAILQNVRVCCRCNLFPLEENEVIRILVTMMYDNKSPIFREEMQ